MKHNFNKVVNYCGSCGHYNPNAGTFSYCLVQEKDVWEGDHCDKHATEQRAKKWLEDEFKFMGTIFDRGDGRANFPKGDNQ